MSSINPRDQINQASWTIAESIKDALTSNLAAASQGGQLDLKGPAFDRLMTLVKASIEEGYHRSSRVFNRTVDLAIEKAENDAWKQGNLAQPGTPPPAAKSEKPKKKPSGK